MRIINKECRHEENYEDNYLCNVAERAARLSEFNEPTQNSVHAVA